MALSDVVSGAASTFGRYFSLVSLVPSVALVLYVYMLVESGAWSRPPDAVKAYKSLTGASGGTIGFLVTAALVVALAAHSLQFPLVQLYEGYWGSSRFGRQLWLMRTGHHMKLARDNLRTLVQLRAQNLGSKDPRDALWVSGWLVELQRTAEAYPDMRTTTDVLPYMPTRLGNVLRRYELSAGAPFGISSVHAVPYLALVADERDVAYLDDQRATLDLMVRLSATSLLACALTGIFLWDDGVWLLVALLPYGMGFAFYRGSIAVAHEFGRAMATLIALNRTALYRRLRLALPPDAATERGRNEHTLSPLFELNPNTMATWVDAPDSEHALQVDLRTAYRLAIRRREIRRRIRRR